MNRELGGTVHSKVIGVVYTIHTNTIVGHTNSSGHKQYMCTRSGVATNSTRLLPMCSSGVATNSTRLLPICSRLNSSSDSQNARTATIL